MDDLRAVLAALEPELGPLEPASPRSLSRRHHEPQLPGRASAGATTSCGSAARTPSCSSIDRETERRGDRGRRRRRRRARRSSRWLPERRVPRHRVRPGRADAAPRSCASRRRSPRSPRALRAHPRRPAAGRRVPDVHARRRLRARPRASAAASRRRPTCARARRCARASRAALAAPEHEPVPCHNDLLTANFLHDGERVRIVDWEYAGMDDRYFDLGNLSVNNGLAEDDEERAARGLLRRAVADAPRSPRCG